jgi:hypothetical protein
MTEQEEELLVLQQMVGKSYRFEDGNSITIVQIKTRDTGPWVTYETLLDGSIPKRTVMPHGEFMSVFAHLFK